MRKKSSFVIAICGRDHSRPPVVKVKVNDGRAKYLFGEDSGRNTEARSAATRMEWKWWVVVELTGIIFFVKWSRSLSGVVEVSYLAIERVMAGKWVQNVRMTDVHGWSRRRRQGNGERGMSNGTRRMGWGKRKKFQSRGCPRNRRFFFNFFLFFFNLVRARTSSGATVGAVESAMEGKVMMTKVDGWSRRRRRCNGMEEGGVMEREEWAMKKKSGVRDPKI